MGDPVVIAGILAPIEQVHYRQALMPYHTGGSFLGDDEDYHDFRFAARGKNVIGLWIDNPTDATLTWELYGLHAKSAALDDPGTEKIDEDTILTTANEKKYIHAYPYPFYLLRCYFAAEPTDETPLTVSVWIDLYWGRLELPEAV